MCTYQTANVPISGSGKGAAGWFPLSAATVYLDHPVDAPADHTLNIDFRNPDRVPRRGWRWSWIRRRPASWRRRSSRCSPPPRLA